MTSCSLVCKEISSTFSCCVILNVSSFQIEYDAHYTQLNFLKTLSNYANQNVTYACRKSKAWEDGQHSIKLMGSNEMQYHATSKISLRPNVITNECTVSWQFARSFVRNKPPFTIHGLEQHCYGYNLGIRPDRPVTPMSPHPLPLSNMIRFSSGFLRQRHFCERTLN